MKIGLAQINPTVGDFKHNTEKIRAYIEKAKGLSCELVVFSELAICGYPPRDLLQDKTFVDANLKYLDKLVESVEGIGVICGCVHKDSSLHNSAVLFEGGTILHKVHKRVLCNHDFAENACFEPGNHTAAFAYKGQNIALTICEEIFHEKRVPAKGDHPFASMIGQGADLIINIAASPYHEGKRELHQKMLCEVAKTHAVPLLHVNQVGGNDSLVFDGVSMAFDSRGQITARAKDFEETLIVFDTTTQKGDLLAASQDQAESLLKALAMGTRDYVHKCGFEKVVVGMSGGIDSAVTACIAVKALGAENVLGVFLPSQHTSRHSEEDAKALAKNLEIRLVDIPIEPIYDQIAGSLVSVFGKEWSDDVTQQNIQARVRAVLLMALSNKLGHMVLATGNKSELAVGYCTLYGDMIGGLAVISDVSKTKVYDLARFINKSQEVIPARILQKAPSAELKADQKDQDDLPPYDMLDAILKAYTEENMATGEIAAMGFDPEIVADTVRRVHSSEYKRQQAPPGLKVNATSFGGGRRCPIAAKACG